MPSFGGTTPCTLASLPAAWRATPRARGFCIPLRLPLSGSKVETIGPPTFLGNPHVPMPCSTTPVGPTHQAIRRVDAAPALHHDKGSPRAICISRLNHTAWALAVYASQRRLPGHHARLASGCWPALPGGIGYPLGSIERFQNATHPWQLSSFPKPRGARCRKLLSPASTRYGKLGGWHGQALKTHARDGRQRLWPMERRNWLRRQLVREHAKRPRTRTKPAANTLSHVVALHGGGLCPCHPGAGFH